MNAAAQRLGTTGLSDSEFLRLTEIASASAGLSIPASKKSLVQSRSARRMRDLGLARCKDYGTFVDNNTEETRELISVLTTNVSSFYRERHHFEFLVQTIVPELKEKLKNGKRVRLWSAGCSSGQEPYTMAIELIKSIPSLKNSDFLILATDIDPRILRRAVDGVYTEADLESVSAEDRDRFFEPCVLEEGARQASQELKSLVRFRELNLHSDWPMQGAFDAILCRNVVIYFDDETQRSLWPRFRSGLTPGGYLMLGHSERIHPLDDTGFVSAGVTIYRKT